MHRIIEQTAISSCGMVKTPIQPATEETAVHAEYRHESRRTQGPHSTDEARKATEQEAEDAHSAAPRRGSFSHPDLPGPLLLQDHRLCGRHSLRPGGTSGL